MILSQLQDPLHQGHLQQMVSQQMETWVQVENRKLYHLFIL